MSLSYALHENKVSKGKTVYRALIKNRRKYGMDEIIQRMVDSHSGVTRSEALSCIELFMKEIENILGEGGVVSTPLFYAQCSVSGTFNGDEDRFFEDRHKIKIRMRPGKRINELTKNIKAYRVKSSLPCPQITAFIEMRSGLKNSVIKPGSPAIIKGKRLEFDATDADQGVYFKSDKNKLYKCTDVFRNTFSHLFVTVPEDLPKGTYTLSVRSSLKTKSVRVGELGVKITVE